MRGEVGKLHLSHMAFDFDHSFDSAIAILDNPQGKTEEIGHLLLTHAWLYHSESRLRVPIRVFRIVVEQEQLERIAQRPVGQIRAEKRSI